MRFLCHLFAAARLRFALLALGAGCLLWTVLALPLGLLLAWVALTLLRWMLCVVPGP